jgi:hypothetical protein
MRRAFTYGSIAWLSLGLAFFVTGCGDDDGGTTAEICNDGVDNDGDGDIDCDDSEDHPPDDRGSSAR